MPELESASTYLSAPLSRKLRQAHVAVNNLTLDLARRGARPSRPNGAGKTTTMQMLTGNLAPSSGAISICGIDLFDEPIAAKARIGYLPEVPPLYRELTVNEYLILAAKLHRIPRASRADAISAAKRSCGLTDSGRKLIGTLSKGYQQRVGIAQAIVHRPDVVILDEPTIGLDPNQIREIRGLIRELSGAHSVILSTHILPEVEAVCDRVQIMHHGSIVYSDTIVALKQIHSGSTVRVGLRRPPPLASLPQCRELPWPRGEPTLFRVQFAQQQDATDALVKQAAERDWACFN